MLYVPFAAWNRRRCGAYRHGTGDGIHTGGVSRERNVGADRHGAWRDTFAYRRGEPPRVQAALSFGHACGRGIDRRHGAFAASSGRGRGIALQWLDSGARRRAHRTRHGDPRHKHLLPYDIPWHIRTVPCRVQFVQYTHAALRGAWGAGGDCGAYRGGKAAVR